MILKTEILASLIFIVSGIAMAQNDTTLSLSLKEAQDYALQNNTEVVNQRLDIDAAKQKIKETRAIGLPQANASLTHQYIPGDIPTIAFEFDMESNFSALFNTLQGYHSSFYDDLEANQPEPTTGGDDGIVIANKNSSSFSATLSQLIFSGEYLVALQSSRTYLQLSENSLTGKELAIKQNVSSAYFTVLSIEKSVSLLDTSVTIMQNTYKEMDVMYKNGFISDTDLDQLKYTLSTIENTQRTIQRQLEVSKILLKIQLGVGEKDSVVLTQSLEEILNSTDIETLLLKQFNVSENIDYKTIETSLRLNELSLKRQKSLYLPTLSGTYIYTRKINAPDFDFALPHMINFSLDIPIFSSGMKSAQLQSAKIELEKTKNLKDLTEKNLYMAELQSKYDLQNAFDTYNTENEKVQLASKILNKTTIRYEKGMATSIELNEAHTQYLSSVTDYTNATIKLLNAKLELEKIHNQL